MITFYKNKSRRTLRIKYSEPVVPIATEANVSNINRRWFNELILGNHQTSKSKVHLFKSNQKKHELLVSFQQTAIITTTNLEKEINYKKYMEPNSGLPLLL